MKRGFYLQIALSGMKKNKILYKPYILTCISMVMMNYIIQFLVTTPAFDNMAGGATVRGMLGLGCYVMAVFSVIFLFYTNSFLIRRRKKELGLYNILGMGKKNIGLVLFWETLIIGGVSLGAGLFGGMLFSKLAELGLINMLKREIDFSLYISASAVLKTVILFGIIFILIYLNALRQIHTANPTALLNSENAGEKPPKANWLLGFLGVIILAVAYYIAVSIEQPLAALAWFFVAVIMVIAATYLLFVTGSVLLCRILQKKKGYYYKPAHFVSVSSMAYRMKRNGAGLASICILATMVLVMITGSACLYFGAEDSLRSRYPYDINATVYLNEPAQIQDDFVEKLRDNAQKVMEANGQPATKTVDYRMANTTGLVIGDEMDANAEEYLKTFDVGTYDGLRNIFFVPISDYNRLSGQNIHLGKGQAMLFTFRCHYNYDTFKIKDAESFEIVKTMDDFPANGMIAMDIIPSMVLVVPDLGQSLETLAEMEYETQYNVYKLLQFKWYYGINTDASVDKEIAMTKELYESYRTFAIQGGINMGYSCESLEGNRIDFYSTYGGLFFLGIMLSIVFIFAATLIIYYKQVSEGYEDRSRFEIMQKVGMTKKDIRVSINSQMLTVFLLPLVTAVVHLAFAFPLIRKLLMLFNLNNLTLLIIIAAVSAAVFAVFYVLAYRITSNAYYGIVSGGKE